MSQQRINSHHLKNRMLALCPELKSYQEGKYVYLASGHDVTNLLKGTGYSHDSDALVLLKAASILRRGMDKKNDWSLNNIGNVKSLIPKNLLFSLVRFYMELARQKGISFEDISNSNNTAFDIPVISISQLIMSNSLSKPKSESSSSKIYRLNHKETPLTIYTGLLVHHQTRKRNIVDKLHSLGLLASYDMISQIETAVSNDISFRFNLENVLCPTSFKVNLYTCGAIDNIDKNSSSSTAQQSFHGTGISIIQNRSNKEEGNERIYNNLKISDIKRQLHIPLPTSYTNMMPVAMRNDKPCVFKG